MRFEPIEIKDKANRIIGLRNRKADAGERAGSGKGSWNGSFPDHMKYADGSYASADWMMKKLLNA